MNKQEKKGAYQRRVHNSPVPLPYKFPAPFD